MVCSIRRIGRGNGNPATIFSWDYRYRFGNSCVGKTDTHCFALDGILGALDGAFAPDCRYADMGFR